ncbi:hypothetical protein [Pedobacter sp. BMA]|uniref:hypothetical protein n=1 Tax=Pedobacter sp. BMA TaxID=1663685 RepID=UPI00064B3BAC|nr:hypothetical protein [Pedobacter sp. BMA]KLT65720.1 hypothetical protein AB669_11750 [Pedobacter sp. BMA]
MSAADYNDQASKNLISIITFNVTATQTIDGGIIPWVNIGKANEEILNLIDAEEIVIPEHEITVAVDYPLSNPTHFQLYSSIGFSRKLFLIELREKFIVFAKSEEFDINTLDLVALDVYKTESGRIEVTLDIDL